MPEVITNFINSDIFNLILIVMFFLLIILYIVNNIRLKNANKSYMKLIKKLGNGTNLEEVLRGYIEQVKMVNDKAEDISKYCDTISAELKTCIKKVGMVRYNAYEDAGSDLSFALALLDDNNNGVILNGIYSREMSNIYAKKIVSGEPANRASEHEKQAIDIALKQ